MDQLSRKWLVDFAPQPPYGNVNHVRVTVETHVPDLLGENLSRQNLSPPAHQQQQKGVFPLCNVNAPTATLDSPPLQVDLEVGHAKDVAVGVLAAPHQRAHPRDELGERERLHEAVIGADFQIAHAIDIFDPVACRQEEDRCGLSLANLPEHRPTIHAG